MQGGSTFNAVVAEILDSKALYKHRGCAAGHVYNDLLASDPNSAEDYRKALGELGATVLREAVKKLLDRDISPMTFRRHQRGECTCSARYGL